MKLIRPHTLGAPTEVLEELTFWQRKLLIDVIRGKDEPELQKLLKRIHDEDQWIACDCRADTNYPLLHTRQTATQHLGLVRMPGRSSHAPGCPFAEGLSDLYQHRGTTDLAHEMLSLVAAVEADILWRATPTSAKPTVFTVIDAMAAHARSTPPATRLLASHPSRIPKLAVQLRAKAKESSGDVEGLAILAVRDFDRGSITPLAKDTSPILVRGPIEHLADAPGHASISLLRIAKGTDGRYEPVAAVLVPISNRGATVLPTTDAVLCAPTLFLVAKDLTLRHRLRIDLRWTRPTPGSPVHLATLSDRSGRRLSLHLGPPPSSSDLYVQRPGDRPRSTPDREYAPRLADIIHARWKTLPVPPLHASSGCDRASHRPGTAADSARN